ncbi:hypothetical protein RUND412_006929 [Rhizina undulata]
MRTKYGIKGISILTRLEAIDFPRSFPPDCMHLFFENIVPDLFKIYRGNFFENVEETTPDEEATRNSTGIDQDRDSIMERDIEAPGS